MENNFCRNCGAPLANGSAFCSACGTRIVLETKEENAVVLPVQTSNDCEQVIKRNNVCSLLAVIFGAIGFVPILNIAFLPPAFILAIVGLATCKNKKKGIMIASIIVVLLSLVFSASWMLVASENLYAIM